MGRLKRCDPEQGHAFITSQPETFPHSGIRRSDFGGTRRTRREALRHRLVHRGDRRGLSGSSFTLILSASSAVSAVITSTVRELQFLDRAQAVTLWGPTLEDRPGVIQIIPR